MTHCAGEGMFYTVVLLHAPLCRWGNILHSGALVCPTVQVTYRYRGIDRLWSLVTHGATRVIHTGWCRNLWESSKPIELWWTYDNETSLWTKVMMGRCIPFLKHASLIMTNVILIHTHTQMPLLGNIIIISLRKWWIFECLSYKQSYLDKNAS